MAIASTPGPSRARIELLDPLRAVAVLAVLFYHYAFRGAAADGFTGFSLPEFAAFAKYGFFGVQLFFIISGFVIAYSAEGRTASQFAIARITRIYPGFLFCMTVTFAITLAIGAPRFEVTLGQWLANLTMVAPALKQPFMDGAYWSIVYEITFYGWVFMLMSLGRFRRNIDHIVLFWIVISIVNETLLQSGFLRRLLLTDQSGFFCAGLVLYEIHCGRRDRAVMLMLALASLAAINQALIGAVWDRQYYQVDLDNLVIVGITLALVAAVALAVRVRRLPFSPDVIIAIGGVTYPLYLLHQNIGYMLLNKFADQFAPALLITLLMLTMILGSYLVWRFFERPAQKWTKGILIRGLEFLVSAQLRLLASTTTRRRPGTSVS